MKDHLLFDIHVGIKRSESHGGWREANFASSSATIERLESAIRDIYTKLDQVSLSASVHSPLGIY